MSSKFQCALAQINQSRVVMLCAYVHTPRQLFILFDEFSVGVEFCTDHRRFPVTRRRGQIELLQTALIQRKIIVMSTCVLVGAVEGTATRGRWIHRSDAIHDYQTSISWVLGVFEFLYCVVIPPHQKQPQSQSVCYNLQRITLQTLSQSALMTTKYSL